MVRRILASVGIFTMALPLGSDALAQAGMTATTGRPFALRGVELGITLDQFKAIPVPADDGETETQTWCTDQTLPRQLSYWQPSPQEMGPIITCEWFSKQSFSVLGVSNHFLSLGEGKGVATFRFVEKEGAWRLFQISVKANNQYYPAIADALTRKYGAGKTTTEPFQTRSGDMFDNDITVWKNSLSSIRLEERYGERDRYLLTYRDEALSKLVDAEIERSRALAAEKI